MTRKVLIVSRNLPPLLGGIERLMGHVVAALTDEYECHVIGPRGCRRHLPAAVTVRELPAAVPLFLPLALAQVIAARLRHRYALCIGGSGLVAPVCALAAALSRCPWMVWVHGLDLVAASRIYQWAFVSLLRRAAHVIANSRHTAALAAARGIASTRVEVLPPGVDVGVPAAGDFRGRHGLPTGPLLLSVGRLVPRKGFVEFIEHVLPGVLRDAPDARYVIIGSEPAQAAGVTAGTRAEILAAAQRAGVGASVQLLGAVADAQLQDAYAAADVLVFPSRAGGHDVEGFGMVIIEAAAQGTPTVAFDVGGVADAVSPDNAVLVGAGDFTGFAAAVGAVLARADPGRRERCRRHAARYAWPRYEAAVRRRVDAIVAAR